MEVMLSIQQTRKIVKDWQLVQEVIDGADDEDLALDNVDEGDEGDMKHENAVHVRQL